MATSTDTPPTGLAAPRRPGLAMGHDRNVGGEYRPWLYAAALRHAYWHLAGCPERVRVVGVEQVAGGVAGSGDYAAVVVAFGRSPSPSLDIHQRDI